jgi:predicted ATP-grasp superfamily ATP-dependent carboligase
MVARRTVLITNATGGAGLACARSLGRAGFDVVSLDTPPCLPLGLRSRYLSAGYRLANGDGPRHADELLGHVLRLRPAAFLPLGTQSVAAVSRNLDRFVALTAVNVPAYETFLRAYNKGACISTCTALGIECPRVYSLEEALSALEKRGDGQVLVVKPSFDAGAARAVRYVRNRESLLNAVAMCTEQFGAPLIQEYIPGGPEAMKVAILLFSQESRLAAAFTARKGRQWPASGGLSVTASSTAEHDLVTQVLPFFETVGWRGPAEVELKLDERDGRHKVIEINPRFPSTLRFACYCGLDLPALALRLALEQESMPRAGLPSYKVGMNYVNPGLFLRAAASELRSTGPRLSVIRRLLNDLRGSWKSTIELLDDPSAALGITLSQFRGRST